MRALVFGHNAWLMAPVPTLLSRAGFTVDVVSEDAAMATCRNVAEFLHAPNADAVVEIANKRARRGYDLFVPGDDVTMAEILRAPISDAEKARLLPVVARDNWVHIYSKIGLSKVLSAHGIDTPAFRVAHDRAELEDMVRDFGQPVVVKNDSSGGGAAVFLCTTSEDVASFADKIIYPVLVQEWIDGDVVDLSGFFQQGKIVFFSYSEVLEVRPDPHGPSVLRRYLDLKDVDAACLEGVEKLGKALGANGFANIGSVRAKRDGKLYFFEADMGPIVWIEFGKFIGDDPAQRIVDYFYKGKTLDVTRDNRRQPADAAQRGTTLPFFYRLTYDEIAANKYDCQKYRIDYFGPVEIEEPTHWAIRRFWLKPLAEFFLALGRVGRFPVLQRAGLALWQLMPQA